MKDPNSWRRPAEYFDRPQNRFKVVYRVVSYVPGKQYDREDSVFAISAAQAIYKTKYNNRFNEVVILACIMMDEPFHPR
jgi:hypothetical protein